MKIVHININLETSTPQKENVPVRHFKKMTEKELFAQEMALQDYKRALKLYADRIAKVQEVIPGWLPPFR